MVIERADGERFKTFVEEWDGLTLKVVAPLKEGRVVNFFEGEEVLVTWVSSGLYRSKAVVGGMERGKPLLLVLYVDGEVERVQRRAYARVLCSLPFRLLPFGARKWSEGTVVDISGGGLKGEFERGSPPPVGKGKQVLIHIPSLEVVAVGREVRREGDFVALKFEEIAEEDKDKIVKFVLKRQIELRRRRLLR